MDFQLSSDQKMLQDTVRSFTKQKSAIGRFRELREAGDTWDAATWAELGELGWLSVPFAEEHGGFGGTFFDVAIILEGLGTTLVPEPYTPALVAGLALARSGNTGPCARLLPPLLEGQSVVALAHTERTNRFGAEVSETKASAQDGGYRVRGEKVFVPAGHIAQHLIVSARLEDETALFVVDADAAGVSRRAVQTQDAHGAAMIELDVQLDAASRLGESDATEVLAHALDYGAAATCAESVGVGQAVLDMTIEHLKTRTQFGKAIGAFQVLQHHAVDMFVHLELMKSMSALAAGRVDDMDAATRRPAVSAAKAHIARSGRALTQTAIQLHGGIGITEEHDVGLYLKRMHTLSVMYGDADYHTRRFAADPGFAAQL